MPEEIKKGNGHKNDKILRVVHDAFARDASEEQKDQLRKSLQGFRRDLAAHPYVRKLARSRKTMRRGTAGFF